MRARQQEFTEETDTFHLHVIYSGHELTITLKDFSDWKIYSSQYTKYDIGREIDRKMGLLDVFNAFCLGVVPEVQNGVKKLKCYEFATVIKDDDAPCYKIDKNGKVTVYYVTLHRKTNEMIVCESNLQLEQLKVIEKESEILQREENDISEGQNQNNDNVQTVYSREQILAQITRLEKQKSFQAQTNQEFLQKLDLLIQSSLKLTQSNQQMIQRNKRLEEKYNILSRDIQIQDKRRQDNFGEVAQHLKSIKLAQTLHSLPQANLAHFKIDGLKVQYISLERQYTQYIFNFPIRPNTSSTFKLKITKMTRAVTCIGIIDYNKQKNERFSRGSQNTICYYASRNDRRFPYIEKKDDGFRQGDVVEVNVNRSAMTVKFFVNGVEKDQLSNQILGDNKRIFMPYVQMRFTHDSVEWVMDN